MRRRWLLLLPVAAALLAAFRPAAYDPTAAARAEKARGRIGNVLAHIPPQCYTDTQGRANPCWVCHSGATRANGIDDWQLQADYAFNALGRENHWRNLFVDRRAPIAQIRDAEILRYVRQDNSVGLREALLQLPAAQRPRWIPDLDWSQGFDAQGWARDGSGWRAFRYQPFPGSFWPANGSSDDVLIRLPPAFRRDAQQQESRAVYALNLALLEAAVAVPDTREAAQLQRAVEAVDERLLGFDLDGDGRLDFTQRIQRLPPHYAGAAGDVVLERYRYPVGTEFLHSLRYLDPDAADMRATRFKELRYARKIFALDAAHTQLRDAQEAREQTAGGWPYFGGDAFSGIFSERGWQLQAYIEQADGRLRLQTREEQMSCMGCHSGIGITVDASFALPRKPPGAAGWGYQSLAGLQDRPQAGSRTPEYALYLRRAGAGDEYRNNAELLRRYFPNGALDTAALRRIAVGGDQDIRTLLLPSRERALALDKAYRTLVREQSFALGREAPLQPPAYLLRQIKESRTGLREADDRVFRDARLWLEWDSGDARSP
ncbi:hypothetical protein SAMN04488038_11510 [Solimonas aquatica]|uniref:EF-hand domain-containing protein n=1 Tax=Solimonas aquatica TaxID=489703 RepID=A0A1H9L5Q1_9GAMM|nr:hypothetical protein [Solimonas aquatica]SER06343.1 hypothetical protein SAMN04488038_11510 [Solimonas aquatica]